MKVATWWDDAAIVLLAHTGDFELAEQFARWCEAFARRTAESVGGDQ